MFLKLLLALTVIPLVELALLLRIGGWLGVWPTLGMVIGTGVVGTWLARREGLRSWNRVRAELAAGRLPARELLHAQLVFVAGVLLLTPGVLTDLTGLLLLLRPIRNRIAGRLQDRLAHGAGFMHFPAGGSSGPGWASGRAGQQGAGMDGADTHGAGPPGASTEGAAGLGGARPTGDDAEHHPGRVIEI